MTKYTGKDGIVTIVTSSDAVVTEHGVNNFEITYNGGRPSEAARSIIIDWWIWVGMALMVVVWKWDTGIGNILWSEAKMTGVWIGMCLVFAILAAIVKSLFKKGTNPE